MEPQAPPVTEHDPPKQAEVQEVQAFLRLFDKALRATQLYLPNNPVYEQALQNLAGGVPALWQTVSELSVRVERDFITWEGVEVYRDREEPLGIAWTLYKDGIRAVTLLPGVEEEELIKFLHVLHEVRQLPEDAEDDLLTLFWEQDFGFIKYVSLELGTDDVPAFEVSSNFGDGTTTDQDITQSVREEVEELERNTNPMLAQIDDTDATLYFLETSEVERIKEELNREYTDNLRINVLSMLFDVLELQTYDNAPKEVINILELMLPHILGAGDFGAVAYVLRESQAIAERHEGLGEELRTRLLKLAGSVSEPSILAQILQALDESHTDPEQDELAILFGALEPDAMETILAWLPRLRTDAIRSVLVAALDPMAKDNPDTVGQALRSNNVQVVRGALALVAEHGIERVARQLGPLARHADVDVRKQLIAALQRLGTPSAMQTLRSLLDDGDRDVRIAAAGALGARDDRLAFEPIADRVQSKGFKSYDVQEKRAFLEAFGRLGQDKAIEHLEEILVGRGLLKRKGDTELRACAASALGLVNAPAARDTLQSLTQEKDAVVRAAVVNALRRARGA